MTPPIEPKTATTTVIAANAVPEHPLSTKEAAALLKVSEQTVRKFLRIGRLQRLPDIGRNRILPGGIKAMLRLN